MIASRLVAICLVGLCSAGCATAERQAKVLPVGDLTTSVISYPTELRGAYIRPDGSSIRYCAEPAPDVALSTVEKITANLKAATPSGVSGEGSFGRDFQATVVELAGRTQLVLLARETLYRACELDLNNPGSGSQAAAMYTQVLELIRDLGAAEKDRAEAAKAVAETERVNAMKSLR
jgi:hypothetical protein